jgi:hypothetical protein
LVNPESFADDLLDRAPPAFGRATTRSMPGRPDSTRRGSTTVCLDGIPCAAGYSASQQATAFSCSAYEDGDRSRRSYEEIEAVEKLYRGSTASGAGSSTGGGRVAGQSGERV